MEKTKADAAPAKERSWVKWEVLLLLWMAYLLNQGDRQVFNTVLPAIREALNLTDTSVGLIATIFNLFYACCVPFGGWAGDRFSRKWVVTVAIIFWSVATMFTGLANGGLPADSYEECGHRRRRGLLRAGELLASWTIPH